MIRLFKQEFNISLINILITSLMAGVIGDAFLKHYVAWALSVAASLN
jgi:hypothetical protein